MVGLQSGCTGGTSRGSSARPVIGERPGVNSVWPQIALSLARTSEATGQPTARACQEGYACVVMDAAETLLEQAMMLPVEDRALLASGLLASLDADDIDEPEVDQLWSAETDRRAAELASGESKPVTWEHMLARIDKRRS